MPPHFLGHARAVHAEMAARHGQTAPLRDDQAALGAILGALAGVLHAAGDGALDSALCHQRGQLELVLIHESPPD
ncbi:hypothetical protein D3C85_1903980 [compost metagenome]